ncbi:MAG TPA: BamA/TamA family outer membrane protein [Chitinophagaceae bacterium]|nr:BamA/TamA family outer membrane protein [Chitinophagaceae bacterium]
MSARHQPFKLSLPLLAAVLFFLFASSCTIVKNYPQGQPFVYRTNINVIGNFTNQERETLASRLKGQLDDSMRSRSVSKVAWSVMKNPPVFQTANADKSIIFMRALLKSLGYFTDTISYHSHTDTAKNNQLQVTTTFDVRPGKVVRIDSFAYNIKQKELQELLVNNKKEALIGKGAPFAKTAISAELDRIVDLYRNNGYMRFGREELIGLWDTLDVSLLKPTFDPLEQAAILQKLKERRQNPTANLEIRLKPGTDSSKLKKYYIGNITVYPDITIDTSNFSRKETVIDDVRVIAYRNMFKPGVIPQSIYFHKGEAYNLKKQIKTINRFNSLGAWRLVSVDNFPRKGSDTADFVIRLTPAKKYSFTANLEGSRNQTAVSGNLFGLAINLGLQNRNFAMAANQSSTNMRFGIEVSNGSLVQTRQFVLSHNIYFPRPIPNTRWIPTKFKDNFRSVLSFNAANTERKDLFNLTTFNASWGYEFQYKNKLFSIRLPNFEYSYLKRRPLLDTLFKYNPSLSNIFTDGFISSIAASMTINGGKNKNINLFRTNMEASGLVAGLVKNKFLDDNLYRYIKVDAEFTRKIVYGKNALALRLFGGVGYELNSTVNPQKKNNLPFFKQYFAGGPNSMRAWRLRRLGPGSVVKPFSGTNGVFERYGDVQLEANAEYRFPLFKIAGVQINGAFFTDAGNVWLLKKNAGLPEEVFQFSRLGKDIAIGSGMGVRIDFDFFLVRLDFSHKVKDPSPTPDKASLQNKWFGYVQKDFFRGTQFQLAISYPFIL